ncbi:MAG: large subunit of alpha-aminoadipate reductase [Peltula sp. TS41687]|nr:MAG: large subunit of alpha-aminoadipate reductase [Peltula sp. TS41687]
MPKMDEAQPNGAHPQDSRMNLPDPTQGLNWSAFRGPIHEIFAANAERHPDRLCIVETTTPSAPRRDFTYGKINAASNILAHHMLQSGVQRGEVVMIYAHRGVDLVLAIMGVLKAGATFSVIDPAYPPDRQIIYLDVAQPRALVVIDEATIDAGPLSEKVRVYIRENLQLRTEIPGLRIDALGNLRGGIVDGTDILGAQISLGTQNPSVLVGPDSNPTLSFTSGSEGRPKGVLGRHFSLTYYFPWMSERFNLTENDRFTMLSGIAHDPIQRDIFTPLFLGAQLLIPAKEDIQNEKLAEWMRENDATVTHLTPAMGQILVGGASAEFPSLHHAFFVGDILIKRDCRVLQKLAPNVRIVNMYGSTETQRAVSYYEIPSRYEDPECLDRLKDVIPAGKGMVDVQLLVVDPSDHSRLCSPGVLGEIYVRAGGLAEGYLALPDLTQSKFMTNWFVDPQKWVKEDQLRLARHGVESWRELYLGPRDRLYKTGDLGRYTTDGDVECSGRVDNQVKIRGFRIELGEIDTFLSQHPLVRENVTLVRRDQNEEHTLVSYIVPDMNGWHQWLKERALEDKVGEEDMVGMLSRFGPLRDDVRSYLREKLPAYAVPTVFIPLKRMPLNPNGKVDKPALPFPDATMLAAAAAFEREGLPRPQMSDQEHSIAEIWASLIPHLAVDSISPDDSFFDLGGHSLLAQQMIFAIKRRWKGINVTMNTVFQFPSLRAFAAQMLRLQSSGNARTSADGENSTINGESPSATEQDDYSADARALIYRIPRTFAGLHDLDPSKPITILLTGATGFLGAYILRDLLNRQLPHLRIIVHVRAPNQEAGLKRVQQTCEAYGVWSPSWSSQISCVTGNLGDTNLGISAEVYDRMAKEVDLVIHNGAWVHWVYPYQHLKPANVLGTIDALQLCAVGKPKRFVFVSSTSVLDTKHYVELSDSLTHAGVTGIPESDDLEGSRQGLGTGYGQSKWVAESLVREAGRRGLVGAIIRPGYVTGDSHTGVTNTDDFLIRMIKGCIQLSSRPDITNSVNMVPVDHVARTVTASAFFPPVSPLGVVHITSHPRLRFNEFLSSVESYGYNIPELTYDDWRARMEQYAADAQNQVNALMPLYHFVTNDLPSDTKAPELDDTNAVTALRRDAGSSGLQDVSAGASVTDEVMGVYVAYLVGVGYLPLPSKKDSGMRALPNVQISNEQLEALGKVGGRGALV